ncbi:NCS1 family nucleobase:cation symporter-1 [Herbaspirillum huttiense F1]|jgi:Cytosine/uracil/thiamine/allantoin permeases|uniref:NCS1 family nucleobase:cation symporter-1 n=1 Tax=Herbaspirillum huttiense subsp. lycopersici TaxID=3074428 RepID=A0ABU2ESY0_9BURK|nr:MULTISPECIES: NCS1 family nucleobase:cation symporter-1 [Herbaspirillum]MBP1317621.1 NCS1 family nucleobase:cation symporter-1 [Herbaspirillum sp. 1130]MDR6743181.1 NCS1 family nucleobase:cation symporter-1 [Herbaspirillum sp. 1173]MDR9851256.1 NCS1 family nucleobase:cation symporter-1 [Herbaspirillum huttiense SE1]MDT0357835.1 NCS1 family nucleobase:cation symporter-1 [Herbaspirillum huttiense F1]QBP77490.1 NCS1 family nucleobase:cation symporter-1 [Herbaspirillum huttiense]
MTTDASPSAAPGAYLAGADDARLTNEDLAPLKKQTWGSYNIFAFWMSDVHSVGGYVFAGSLFALGLTSWQVLISLLIGISIVYLLCNLVARPSQAHGVPYPVMSRLSFGVLGANVPAMIRGLIAVAWYGIQTYLASAAFVVVVLKFFPELKPYADVHVHSFAGLSTLGWGGFLLLWVLQALVFWNGMETIKKFIDFAGPAVYVVMFILAGWMIYKAGWQNVGLNLGEIKYSGWAAVSVMITAISLVVSYFSGPMLNFGDFSRYCHTFADVKRGNFWGLPVNFLAFSIVTVVTTSATIAVFGELITDPVETVSRIDSTTAAVIGALTFLTATIGINIVANFVSAAFDFSNLSPSRISWRAGGMIAATASIFITPWNLFGNPEVIHYTLDVLGGFIGPLYGILLSDYYLVKQRQVKVEDLYTMRPEGRYWYTNGVNRDAVKALVLAAAVCVACVMLPQLRKAADFSWFIGAALGAVFYLMFARKR